MLLIIRYLGLVIRGHLFLFTEFLAELFHEGGHKVLGKNLKANHQYQKLPNDDQKAFIDVLFEQKPVPLLVIEDEHSINQRIQDSLKSNPLGISILQVELSLTVNFSFSFEHVHPHD